MLKKKIISLLMVMTIALTFVGCDNKVGDIALEKGQTAIHISKDGKVQYGVAESFDKDYYDKNELKSTVENEVDEFNSDSDASGKDALSLKSMDVKKDVATMIMEFASTTDFGTYILKYNNPDKGTFYIGDISDNEDCEIKGKFYAPDNKKKSVSEDKISDLDDNILIVNEQMKVQIEGTVKYVSENCKISDGVVETAKTDDGISYIVYTLK